MKISAILCLLFAAACVAEFRIHVENVTVIWKKDSPPTAVIPCTYYSDVETNPTLTWYANGNTRLYQYREGDADNTFQDAKIEDRLEINNGSLVIPDAKLDYNSKYGNLRCVVEFPRAEALSADVTFLVAELPAGPPKATLNPYGDESEAFDIQDRKVAIGSCISAYSFPASDIVFYRNGKDFAVKNSGELGIFLDPVNVNRAANGSSTTSKELIKNLEIEDHQAEFTCSVITKYGGKVHVVNGTFPKFNVNHATSKAEIKADKPFAYLGETITLECSGNGFPKPEIYINNDATSSLKITVTKDLDGKAYTCSAENGDGSAEDVYVLEVLSLSEPTVQGPKQVALGESVTLNCSTTGSPAAKVAWYKGDAKVSDSGILTFDKTTFDNKDEYICRADNGHDELKKSTTFFFDVRGIVLKGQKEETIKEVEKEKKLTISCTVRSNPKAEITWSDPDVEPVETMVENTHFRTSQIEIGPITAEMSEKTYTCTAENEDGQIVTRTIKLPVIEEPASATAGIVIGILVVLLVIAIIIAVLYNKGIICKKGEKGDESAEGDIAVEINNDGDDVESGNVKQEENVQMDEQEKLMNGDGNE